MRFVQLLVPSVVTAATPLLEFAEKVEFNVYTLGNWNR